MYKYVEGGKFVFSPGNGLNFQAEEEVAGGGGGRRPEEGFIFSWMVLINQL